MIISVLIFQFNISFEILCPLYNKRYFLRLYIHYILYWIYTACAECMRSSLFRFFVSISIVKREKEGQKIQYKYIYRIYKGFIKIYNSSESLLALMKIFCYKMIFTFLSFLLFFFSFIEYSILLFIVWIKLRIIC